MPFAHAKLIVRLSKCSCVLIWGTTIFLDLGILLCPPIYPYCMH